MAEGEEKNVEAFILALSNEAPAAADVRTIDIKDAPLEHFHDFKIVASESEDDSERTLVSPDIATCDDCMRELFDKNDRRYHYPFINCTNCGPRFTIIDDLPYDRKKTSMAKFKMCQTCNSEYKDPANRRFHAQPNACFECGPHVYLDDFSEILIGDNLENSDKIFSIAASEIREGKILAVKGLGGFHFVCDAKNEGALKNLRERKQRDNKAFAVMVKNDDVASKFCEVSEEEKALLKGSEKPIVLLRKKPDFDLPFALSAQLPELGVMLPYTPVQALLIDAFEKETGDENAMLVMTSGNIHDCPIVTGDEEATDKFKDIADAILGNNRKILTRFDDSVARILDFGEGQSAIQFIRRARGYAPKPIKIAGAAVDFKCFAAGPQQKNTFAYAIGGQTFISQHIGDLNDAQTIASWFEAKNRIEKLFNINDNCAIALDSHPEYTASKWAREHVVKAAGNLCMTEVQHHHAHIASALGENNIEDAAIGFAFDGTGYGADGAIWGGEVMLANLSDYERFANLAYFALPGGEAAIKNPLRCAAGLFYAYDMLDDLCDVLRITQASSEHGAKAALAEIETSVNLIEAGVNVPYTSSMGRLFDAISAALGICTKPTYEGEAAILLEASLQKSKSGTNLHEENFIPGTNYTFELTKNTATEHSTAHDTSVLVIDAGKVLRAVVEDVKAGAGAPTIARRFHDSVSDLVLLTSQVANQIYEIKKCALAGGVWMNRYLVEQTVKKLQRGGFDVILNKELPPNDGGVSFGQATVCANKLNDSGDKNKDMQR